MNSSMEESKEGFQFKEDAETRLMQSLTGRLLNLDDSDLQDLGLLALRPRNAYDNLEEVSLRRNHLLSIDDLSLIRNLKRIDARDNYI